MFSIKHIFHELPKDFLKNMELKKKCTKIKVLFQFCFPTLAIHVFLIWGDEVFGEAAVILQGITTPRRNGVPGMESKGSIWREGAASGLTTPTPSTAGNVET